MSNQIEQRNDRIKTIYRLCWVGLVFAVIGFLSSIIQPASYIVMAAFGALGTQAYSPELVLYLVVQLVSAACTLFMLIFYIWSVSKKNQQQRKRRLTLFLLLQSVFSFVVFGLNLLFISVSILQIVSVIDTLILNISLFIFALLLYRKAHGNKSYTRSLKPLFIVALCAYVFKIVFIFYGWTSTHPESFPTYILYALVAIIPICVLIYTQIYLPYLALTDEAVYRRFFVHHPFSA